MACRLSVSFVGLACQAQCKLLPWAGPGLGVRFAFLYFLFFCYCVLCVWGGGGGSLVCGGRGGWVGGGGGGGGLVWLNGVSNHEVQDNIKHDRNLELFL